MSSMLNQAKLDAIREHVDLDARTQELIRLARADLYHGPIAVGDEDEPDYPGFVAACRLIRDAVPSTDLYVDAETDEVIGDAEPLMDLEYVLRVGARDVVRALVGSELARYL